MVGFARAFMRDCRVDSESLALAEILDVGPGGNHLARPLTRAAHRGYWQPDLIDHGTYDRWRAGGQSTFAERLCTRRDELLATERPFRLSEETSHQLDDFLTDAMAR